MQNLKMNNLRVLTKQKILPQFLPLSFDANGYNYRYSDKANYKTICF